MGSGTFYPSEDGVVYEGCGEIYYDFVLYFGNDGGWNHSFICFENVSIPPGSIVTNCKIRLNQTYYVESSVPVLAKIYFNAADNAIAPTTPDEYFALSKTTGLDWDIQEEWLDGNWYETIELKDVLQEVIDRPGWASGNNIMALIEDDGSSIGKFRTPKSEDDGTDIPELVVTWEEAGTVPVAGLTVGSFAPVYREGYSYPAPLAGLEISALAPHSNYPPLEMAVPAATLGIGPHNPAYVWSIPARKRPAAQIIYRCYLANVNGTTGEYENVIELPMESWQARMKKEGPSYLSVVVPKGSSFEAEISSRSNGFIVIKGGYRFQDGTEALEIVATAEFESLRTDTGARNDSATISGHKVQAPNLSPKTWPLSGVSYRALYESGKRRYRCQIDMFLRPGDIAVYGSEQIVVGEIVYTINAAFCYMEVVEA